ncbi:MAG TPA: ATP-binding protein, partial [Chitinophagales bacterium]|nr:ATP-binding protein [Chitinophagales bacterium]
MNQNYGADSIQVLEGLEAVRKRPAMYIGDIGSKGLHHLVYEVVDNSIDEALAGYCSNIFVSINADNSITVQDDGRGIPVDIHKDEGRSALEVVMTVLHAGGKFDKNSYKVSGGLHGVGVSCVNALSEKTHVIVERDGKKYEQTYERGAPMYAVREIGISERRGTTTTFKPDDTIFTVHEYNYDTLATRLRELAYLNRGIRITLTDFREQTEEGTTKTETFYSEGGLVEFVRYLDATRIAIIPNPIYLEDSQDNIVVEVAMQYNTTFNENVHSYVNNINTIEGGTHVTGFRKALTRV